MGNQILGTNDSMTPEPENEPESPEDLTPAESQANAEEEQPEPASDEKSQDAPDELPQEVSDALDEVEFYVSTGFIEDAIFALEDTMSRIDHPALHERLAQLRAMLEGGNAEEDVRSEQDVPNAKTSESEPQKAQISDASTSVNESEDTDEPEEIEILDDADFIEELDEEDDVTPLVTEDILDPLVEMTAQPEIEEDVTPLEDEIPTAVSAPLSDEPGVTTSEIEENADGDAEPAVEYDTGSDLLEDGGFNLYDDLEDDFLEEAFSSLEAPDTPDAAQHSQSSGSEQYDEHYDLGIAYKEMGLIDKALAEFELAMENPSMQVPAGLMIGSCYKDKGLFSKATVELKKLLHQEGLSQEQELEIFYALGDVYESMNDAEEALYYYERIHKKAPQYRDVSEKISKLKNVSS